MNLNSLVANLNEIEFAEKYDLVIICAALHHFVELEKFSSVYMMLWVPKACLSPTSL